VSVAIVDYGSGNLHSAAKAFERAGATIEPVAPFLTADILAGLDGFFQARLLAEYQLLPPDRQAKVLPFIAAWCRRAERSTAVDAARNLAFIMQMREKAVAATEPYDFLISPTSPITAYAASSFPPGSGILAGTVDLMHRIRTEFKYDPKATVISTPLMEVFEKRHGVCQDFAHVMIAGLRGLGLPAAYVSGYLRTIPPPGKPRLQGADATHAWVSLWCGVEIGWIGFDPTNDLLVENDHIVLAVGRDFSDVSPVDGIIVGSRKQKLSVAVDVLLVE